MSWFSFGPAEAAWRTSWRIKLVLLALSCAVALALTEVVLRVAGPFPRAGKTPDHVLWRPDEGIGFAPATRLDAEFATNEWRTRVRTDEYGFRIPDSPPRDAGRRPALLFLGDSQTMGIQVPAESSFVELVGTELARRGLPWRVVNAGCNGFNTVQASLFFDALFAQGLRPRVVVYYATNNDLFEDVPGLPYGRYAVDPDGTLVRLPPDPVAIDRLKRAKAQVPRPVNAWLRHSALIRHLWYSYRILRSPGDVANWVRSNYLRDEFNPASASEWAAATAAVSSLRRLVTSYGGTLVIAVHPDPVEWSDGYYDRLRRAVPELSARIDRMRIQNGYRRVAKKVGVPFVDMLDRFPEVSVRDFRFALDPHANESGHRIIATQLLSGLDQLGVFREAAGAESVR